jgi:competence protein ComEC
MISRPLVPALGATILGILVGSSFQVHLPVVILPLAVLLVLAIFSILPFRVHPSFLVAIFILLGINSQAARTIPPNLSSLADGPVQIGIEGTIYTPPYMRAGSATFSMHGERIFRAGDVERAAINLVVRVYGYRGGLTVGDRIRIPAEIREFSTFHNPGGFDYRFYMQSRGMALMAVVGDGRYVVPMGEGELGFLDSVLERIRRPLRLFFHRRLSSHTQAIYSALILGERQGLTSRIREPFDRSGVGHIMAVSGLHLGLVAWLFFTIFRRILSRCHGLLLIVDIRKLAALITAVPVLGYGLLTGFQLSSQRAVVMILVFLCSIIIGKERDVWSSLCLAALVILLVRADSLFTASFQLSFIAVAGILWLSPLIFSFVWEYAAAIGPFQDPGVLRTVLKYVIGLVAVTTAATVMTIPLIAHHFHRFSLVALPANLTVVPMIGLWVVPIGLLSSAALLISPALAGFLLSLGGAGLDLAISLVQFWSDLSWSSIWVISPSWLEIILVYGLLYMVVRFSLAWFYKVLLAVVVTALFVDMGYWVYQTRLNRNLRVAVLDVGRSNAALIQFPGKERMLIEHHVFEPWGFNLSRIAIAPYLWHHKITRVDYLVSIDQDLPRSDRLRFMVETFHVREIISGIPRELSIDGASIRAERAGEVVLSYRGWSFLFSHAGVHLHKENPGPGEECLEFLIITNERKMTSRGIQGIRMAEAGAVTLSINQKGSIRVRSFLQKNLPLGEGG